MLYIAYAVHIFTCLFLILTVLLQQGKGADLSVFGGGSTQAAFGARGAATVLHKLTVVFFVVFIFTTIGIGILQRSGRRSSIMSDIEQTTTEPAPTPSATPSTADTAPETTTEAGPRFEADSAPTTATDDSSASEAAPEN